MPRPENHETYNRDDAQKPGRPPRTAYEPIGAEGSSRTRKTATDPASGEPTGGEISPARPGSKRRARRRG